MGLPLLSGAFRVQLLFSQSSATRPWSTKFDYVQDEPVVGPGASLDVAEAFETAFSAAWTAGGTAISSAFSVGTQLDTVRVYALEAELQGAEVPGNAATDGAGTQYLPGEVAIVTSLRTAILGRRYRGRQYWGGLAAPALDTAGLVATGTRTALVNLVTAVQTLDLGESDLNLAVLSTAPLGLNPPQRPPATAQVVTQILCDQFPDTQRRRGPR